MFCKSDLQTPLDLRSEPQRANTSRVVEKAKEKEKGKESEEGGRRKKEAGGTKKEKEARNKKKKKKIGEERRETVTLCGRSSASEKSLLLE